MDQIDEQKDKASNQIQQLQTHIELVRSITADISVENESLVTEIRQLREETLGEELRVGRKRIGQEDLKEELATAEGQKIEGIEKSRASSERAQSLIEAIDREFLQICEVFGFCY
jgi:hypothetical protein